MGVIQYLSRNPLLNYLAAVYKYHPIRHVPGLFGAVFCMLYNNAIIYF